MRRWISTERPSGFAAIPFFPGGGGGGSIAYSAVSHPPAPGPLALSQGGRSRSSMAVQRTRVSPNEVSTLPPAWRVNWRWKAMGRSSSGSRPSWREKTGAIADF